MKCLKIRTSSGSLPSQSLINRVITQLKREFKVAGFKTDVYQLNSTAIKIGLHGCSFRIDTTKHGYNLRLSPHNTKRTSIPTWDQRVIFNNIVNKVFNKFELSSNITSGPFTIRDGLYNKTEIHWKYEKPEYMYHNELSGYIVTN